MKKLFTNYFYIFITLISVSLIDAQCNISTFTVSEVSGVCVQDGKINVTIPGATSCTGGSAVIASLYDVGSTSALSFINLTAAGTGSFLNLAPGDYEVQLQQGAIASARKPVTVTTAYERMQISLVSTNLTCQSSDPLFSENGTIDASFTGGNGPFKVELLKNGAVIQSVASTTVTSHFFENLGAGNYQVRITDLSSTCVASETRSTTLVETIGNPIQPPVRKMFYQADNGCDNLTLRLDFNGYNGNPAFQNNADNIYVKINGVEIHPNSFNVGNGRVIWDGLVPKNAVIEEIYVTDGCTFWSETNITAIPPAPDFLIVDGIVKKNDDCSDGITLLTHAHDYNLDGHQYYSFNFSTTNTLTTYQEQPADSNNWVEIDVSINNWWISANTNYYRVEADDAQTRYKIVATDYCKTVEKIFDARTKTYFNPLESVTIQETKGVYEGTSGIELRSTNGVLYNANQSSIMSYPITVSVERADGQTSMQLNPTQPLSLAGSYTLDFPVVATFEQNPQNTSVLVGPFYAGPTVNDLPPGEYNVTITDRCGYAYTRNITLSNPATYNVDNKVVYGCASSDYSFDMGATNVVDFGYSEIWTDDGGQPGTLVRNRFQNPANTLNGIFTNIAPGDYIFKMSNVLYSETYLIRPGQYAESAYSAIRGERFYFNEYYEPFTVRPYTPLSFASFNVLCDPNDPNTAILSLEVEGTPVDYITYSIWNAADNPDTAAPVMTFTTTDLTEMSHIFTGLSTGEYKVRVIHDCGFTEQDVTIQEGPAELPAPISIPSNTICDSDPNVSLRVALPESLFDINWYDGNNQLIGTGSSIDYVVPESETITVKYNLTQALGCTNTTEFVDTIDITLTPEYALAATGPGLPTQTGISVLGRSDRRLASDWPGSRESANLVLEGKTLGLVINRIATTAELANIANPVEGMIVFDMEADCLKLYTTQDDGTSFDWYCVSTQTCSNQH